jgi:hypothetical protein
LAASLGVVAQHTHVVQTAGPPRQFAPAKAFDELTAG